MSKKDAAKDSMEQAATVVAAVTTGAALGTSAFAAALPLAVASIFNGIEVFRQKRIEKWWAYTVGSVDCDEGFQERILNGLLNETEGVVVLGVVGGARAATDAVDIAAVPCIAKLTRMYFAGDLTLWFYRAALEILSNVTATELAFLRVLIKAAVAHSHEFPRLIANPFTDDGIAQISVEDGELDPSPNDIHDSYRKIPLTQIRHAPRVFQVLRRSTLAEDAPAGGFGSMSARNVLVVPRSNAVLLARVLQA